MIPVVRSSSSPRLKTCLVRAALVAATLMACTPGGAQQVVAPAIDTPVTAPPETLAEAVEAAYDRNPGLVQQRYVQKERDEGYVQARAQYGPTLNVQTQHSITYEHSDLLDRNAHGTNGQTVATLGQTVFTGGRIRNQVNAARSTVLSGQQSLRQVEQQTVQNVVLVYASVLRDQARLDVARENVAVLRDQYEQNKVRQRVGDVTLTDLAQAQARVDAALITLATVEADLNVSRGEYLEVVGHNPGTLAPLPDLGALPPSIDLAFARAEADNPSLLAAKYTEQASSASAAATRGQLGPTVSAQLQGVYSNTGLRFGGQNGTKEAIAGFTVTQPILAGGALRSRVRQADAQNHADQAGIDIARREALQAVTTAWSQLAAARTSLEAGVRQVDAAQQAFAGMHCEELNGLRSTIETLNAEQELQAAQLQLLQNRYQVYVSHAALLAAIGSLDAKTIATNINVYDPEASFRALRWRGMTPLDIIGLTLDRIGSSKARRPLSADLSGANVPRPDREGPLPAAPGPELTRRPLVPITQSALRLPDGTTATCPLSGGTTSR